jgi:hypothetical protein
MQPDGAKPVKQPDGAKPVKQPDGARPVKRMLARAPSPRAGLLPHSHGKADDR